MHRQTPHNTGVKHMEFTIKGRREKESINEIRSKPKPADVTAKTALMSPSVCTAVQNRRRPPACQSEKSRVTGCEYDHIHRKDNALRSRTVRMRPAQASEQHPQQQREKRPCSAIFRACDCFGGRGRIRPPASLPHYPPRREGRTPPSPSFWKARFINLFAGKSPPLPFIRRYTIPVVNAT